MRVCALMERAADIKPSAVEPEGFFHYDVAAFRAAAYRIIDARTDHVAEGATSPTGAGSEVAAGLELDVRSWNEGILRLRQKEQSRSREPILCPFNRWLRPQVERRSESRSAEPRRRATVTTRLLRPPGASPTGYGSGHRRNKWQGRLQAMWPAAAKYRWADRASKKHLKPPRAAPPERRPAS